MPFEHFKTYLNLKSEFKCAANTPFCDSCYKNSYGACIALKCFHLYIDTIRNYQQSNLMF
jgi:hypothetical protein